MRYLLWIGLVIAALALTCVIFRDNIEDVLIDYPIGQAQAKLADFRTCEGDHSIRNFNMCEQHLKDFAWWGGIVFAFYHEQYGTEAKRESVRNDMCNVVGHAAWVANLAKRLATRHPDKWYATCEVIYRIQ
jgi:hypothetical protein